MSDPRPDGTVRTEDRSSAAEGATGEGATGEGATVFISAGEASGDAHAAALARELRARAPGVRLAGLGGSGMAAAGVELLAGLDRLAVLGAAEVVRRLPDLLRLRRRVRRFLVEEDAQLLVLVDYPDFNLPLARFARRHGIPVLYYIAPQVWAWREGRARLLKRDVDRVCVVLPFERELLERYGAHVEFVGHPLLDGPRVRETPADSGPRSVLGLFPGSREQEVRRLLPDFLDAGSRLQATRSGMGLRIARAPDLPEAAYSGVDPQLLAPAEQVAAEATAAITKSGTSTLQLALAGVPMVVGYRVNPITWSLARRLVHVEHVALVNLVAGERLVPELLQGDMTAEALAAEAAPLLERDGEQRRRMQAGLEGVVRMLGEPGCTRRVATACLELMGRPAWTFAPEPGR